MELVIRVQYHTQWGEELFVAGSIPELGGWDNDRVVGMHYSGDGEWILSIPVLRHKELIEFRLLVCKGKTVEREEWGDPHRICLSPEMTKMIVHARWKEKPRITVFDSTFFTRCVFARKEHPKIQATSDRPLVVRVFAPCLQKNESLVMAGGHYSMGDWNPADGIKLVYTGDYLWEAAVSAEAVQAKPAYKFAVVSRNKAVKWEGGVNRILSAGLSAGGTASCLIEHDLALCPPLWRGAGVALPVFSLRSETSWGIGEFFDLKLLIDWAAMCGMSMVQILPVNDTTNTHLKKDSYPYNAISIYALHPLYLHPPLMGILKDGKTQKRFEKERVRLNLLPQLDYELVDRLKWNYFRLLFQQEKENVLSDSGFTRFLAGNREWLMPYAAYSYLRDLYEESDFNIWPRYSVYKNKEIGQLCDITSPAYSEIIFYCYLQYHLHLQFDEVIRYARKKGVALKGDLPIGVNRTGVEAWISPRLFHMGMQAGAPPDVFAEDGQNWGFPTYDWETMKRDGFAWWTQRLSQMALYFNAYRIDHILGFFRIWEIPLPYKSGLAGRFHPAMPLTADDIKAAGFPFDRRKHVRLDASFETLFFEDSFREGHYHPRIDVYKTRLYGTLEEKDRCAYNRIYNDYFYHRHNRFWAASGHEKLSHLIRTTRMLACGEDLGMRPDSVPEVMSELQILSLEIERMPKHPGVELEDLSRLPYLSVCSTSTHDMPTLRGWWKEERGYDCSPAVCEEVLKRHLASPSMLAIFPLQDWLSVDSGLRNPDVEAERINVPSDPNHYWRYRMHLTLEVLNASRSFNKKIRGLLKGRNI